MNNPESFVLEPAAAPISLVAQMQAVIDEQEATIKAMVREIAFWRQNGTLPNIAATVNSLEQEIDFV